MFSKFYYHKKPPFPSSLDATWSIAGLEVTFRIEAGVLHVFKSNNTTRDVSVGTWIGNDLQNALVARGVSVKHETHKYASTGISARIVAGPGETPPPLDPAIVEQNNAPDVGGRPRPHLRYQALQGVLGNDPMAAPVEQEGVKSGAGVLSVAAVSSGVKSSGKASAEAAQQASAHGAPSSRSGGAAGPSGAARGGLHGVPESFFASKDDMAKALRKATAKKERAFEQHWKKFCASKNWKDTTHKNPRNHTVDTLRFFFQELFKDSDVGADTAAWVKEYLENEEKENKKKGGEKRDHGKKGGGEKRDKKKRRRGGDESGDEGGDRKRAKR